jgi:cold shock CspA family protein
MWNREKGYGFIFGDNKQSYFCHASDIEDKSYTWLPIDQIVHFEYVETERGLRAINVKVV